MAHFTQSLATRVATFAIRTSCRLAARRIDLAVEGREHLPETGPAILAARHFHHFYDGCVLEAITPRPLRILVTLDWLRNPVGLRLMRSACQLANWPVVVRSDAPRRHGSTVRRQLLATTRDCVELLRAEQLLLVFPEGYPNVDPVFTPKTTAEAFLPFQPGFLRFAALAERDGSARVPIVPVGLEYRRGHRWRVTVRFGPPVTFLPGEETQAQVAAIEQQVRRLSALECAAGFTTSKAPGPSGSSVDRNS